VAIAKFVVQGTTGTSTALAPPTFEPPFDEANSPDAGEVPHAASTTQAEITLTSVQVFFIDQ
jgi:hypothetical protein